MSKNIALVPLRGGSKGIPKKNILNLCGKPLCQWSLEAAVQSNRIHDVYVSTDSEEIKNIILNLNMGIKIINRPKHLASDTASTDSVLEHFMEIVEFDNLVTIQATSPLIKSEFIDDALDFFINNNLYSLLSIKRTKQFLWKDDCSPLNYDPVNRPRRQDFKGAAVENGAFYITKKCIIEKYKSRLAGNIGFYEMKEDDSYEIDNMLDLKIIKLIIENRGLSVE